MRSPLLIAGIFISLPISLLAQAQEQYMTQMATSNDFEEEAFYDEADQAREAQAEANFDSIMIPQNAPARSAVPLGNAGLLNVPPQVRVPRDDAVSTTGPQIEVPLSEYSDVRKRLGELDKKLARLQGPAVVLGSAEYSGTAIQEALSLQLKLQVTLGRPEQWKTVPLIGDDVVLAGATVGGQAIPVSRRAGYHVWVTRRTGEVTILVDLLVPARGPRGSIEYDFLAPRTPVTRFSCRFPVPDLEPRLDKAIQSDVRTEGGQSLLSATLRPTTRIHLVGFRDLGEEEGQEAKVYAESLNLLSLDEGTVDMFTVVRYTILYAGTKEFLVQVPAGMKVVSADGEGAFRFTEEKNEKGTLIKGETAFPIRNNYEISFRLHREAPREGESFQVPLPRCVGTEREHGWLGVEVPGKLLLKEATTKEVLPVDMRQLPEEMIRSAVSPILRAYRYHASGALVELVTSRRPEMEPESDSIDRIRAFTTVTPEGDVMTDMRITLRNRLRHSLTLSKPQGVKILSTHLDGQKVKPSESDGKVLLPLKRSTGTHRLEKFTLSVVMESEMPPLGWFGCPSLELPSVNLPVSSLVWSVHLPARNLYTAPEGDIEPQALSGSGSWHRPGSGAAEPGWGEVDLPVATPAPAAGPVGTAHTGAMPVRIDLPQHGKRLEYSRYWVEKDKKVEITFYYALSWLRTLAWLFFAGLLALGVLLVSTRFQTAPAAVAPWLGLAIVVLSFWPLKRLGGLFAVFLGFLFGVLFIAVYRRWFRKAPETLSEWWRTIPERFKAREKDEKAWNPGRVALRICLTIGLCFFGLILAEQTINFLLLLMNPL
jgi:hypothetical protein